MRSPAKAFLLASSAALALAVPALAESYYFRTKPEVNPAQAFSFDPAKAVGPGVTAESVPSRVRGYRGATASVGGDTGASYQICAAADCSDQNAWKTGPTANVPNEFYGRVRVTAGPFGSTRSATLTVGGASAAFSASTRAKDTTPDTLTFAPIGGVEPNVAARSASVEVKGHDGVTLSVSGGGYQICSTVACTEMDNAAVSTGTSTEVASGTRVRLVATPTAFGQPATVTLTAGGTVGTFTATARAKDETPDAITFAAVSATVGSEVKSEIRQLTNHDGSYFTVTGDQPYFRVCTDATCSTNPGWVSGGIVVPKNGYVQLWQQTAPTAGTTATKTASYGTLSTTWTVTGTAPAAKVSFTTCGASGYAGPTLSQCQSAYGASGPTITMSTQGKQEWTVPATGTYRITAAGARGGSTPAYQGGSGFLQVVDANLTAGTKLTIVVGQQGSLGTGADGNAAGGGGATAVYIANVSYLAVSGGGGGAGYQYSSGATITAAMGNGKAAVDGLNGTQDYSGLNPAGSSGNGAQTCEGGGHTGGAGVASDGSAYPGYGTAAGAISASAAGSQQLYTGGSGGFGGGGSGAYGGGGGGGWSGGGCGNYNAPTRATGGGAGGSAFTGTRVSTGTNGAGGYVEIERR